MTTSHESLTGKNRSPSPFLSVSPRGMEESMRGLEEETPRVLPVMTRMPHFADEPDPSILPMRHEPQREQKREEKFAAETETASEVAEARIPLSQRWKTVREQSRALATRIYSDKLLLSSWVCVMILSGMTLVNHLRIQKQTPPADGNEWVLRGASVAVIPNEVPSKMMVAEEPVVNPFMLDDAASSFAAAATNASESVATVSPWERPVTNNYSPWNPALAESPTTPPYAQAVRVEDYVTVPQNSLPTETTPQTISAPQQNPPSQNMPVGFAGYEMSTFAASETQQLAMRPAVPITPPQNYIAQNVAQNGAQNYIAQNPAYQNQTYAAAQPNYQPALPMAPYAMPHGQIPVAATPQTFRNEIAPQHDPRFASPAMNLVEQGNYQVAANHHYGGYAPAPTAPMQNQPPPNTQYPNTTAPQNQPQFSTPPAYYQYPAAYPAASASVIK